jgi:predicted RecB family nuclease
MSLTKSLFVTGVQCHKLLWWKVNEPSAKELEPDKVLQDRFDQGAQVGELARERFPGGVLVDREATSIEGRIKATQAALASDVPAIFEATFEFDGVRVKVDVLLRDDSRSLASLGMTSWRLIEVKMTSSQKDEHIPDAAVQLYVLEKCGVKVSSVEIMHLNADYRYSADVTRQSTDLFKRTDVTEVARAMLPSIPGEIVAQKAALAGALPTKPIGEHCGEPRDCVFLKRCWPQNADHIANLYNVGIKRASDHMAAGIHSVWDLPPAKTKNATVKRQLTSMKENRMIVEPGLGDALKPFDVPKLGFLDFETIMRAVPVWDGMKPHEAAPAQFSYHESKGGGEYRHDKYLAEGPKDCRTELVRQMLDATKHADRVVMYSAYEKTQIRGLQNSVPEFRDELVALEAKLIDLLPVVRENVYHPGFQGSFSIKYVLTPVVPELTYKDLIIVDGLTASVEIARLLFVSGKIKPEEHERVRQDLLNYCERDTWAMVRLLEELRALSA